LGGFKTGSHKNPTRPVKTKLYQIPSLLLGPHEKDVFRIHQPEKTGLKKFAVV
jgi:hypothetical protein